MPCTGVLNLGNKTSNIYKWKKFKRILSCIFGGRQKVQVTNFISDFIFVVFSAANSVGTFLEFAASGNCPDDKFSGASA